MKERLREIYSTIGRDDLPQNKYIWLREIYCTIGWDDLPQNKYIWLRDIYCTIGWDDLPQNKYIWLGWVAKYSTQDQKHKEWKNFKSPKNAVANRLIHTVIAQTFRPIWEDLIKKRVCNFVNMVYTYSI